MFLFFCSLRLAGNQGPVRDLFVHIWQTQSWGPPHRRIAKIFNNNVSCEFEKMLSNSSWLLSTKWIVSTTAIIESKCGFISPCHFMLPYISMPVEDMKPQLTFSEIYWLYLEQKKSKHKNPRRFRVPQMVNIWALSYTAWIETIFNFLPNVLKILAEIDVEHMSTTHSYPIKTQNAFSFRVNDIMSK